MGSIHLLPDDDLHFLKIEHNDETFSDIMELPRSLRDSAIRALPRLKPFESNLLSAVLPPCFILLFVHVDIMQTICCHQGRDLAGISAR